MNPIFKGKQPNFVYFVIFLILLQFIQQANSQCNTNSSPFCEECYQQTTSNCTACNRTQYRVIYQLQNGTKQCKCLDSYYLEASSGECKKCHVTCLTCQTSNASVNCLTCDSTWFRQRKDTGTGQTSCDCITNYEEYTTVIKTCKQSCHYSCETCEGFGSSDCTSCNDSHFRKELNNSNECLCEDGFFDDGQSKICPQCDNECLTCTSNAGNCLTCGTIHNRYQDGNKCPCLDGYYDNESAFVCLKCDYTCDLCYNGGGSDCTVCDSSDHRVFFTSGDSIDSPTAENTNNPFSEAFFNEYTNLDYPLLPGQCQCESQYYDNGSEHCQDCDYTCHDCYNGSSSDCENCNMYEDQRGFPEDNQLFINDYGILQVFNSADDSFGNICQLYELYDSEFDTICRMMFGPSSEMVDYYYDEQCIPNYSYYTKGIYECDEDDCYIYDLDYDEDLDCFENDNICLYLECSNTHLNGLIQTNQVDECNCLNGYFENCEGYCEQCDFTCKTCDGWSEYDCLSCDADLGRSFESGECVCDYDNSYHSVFSSGDDTVMCQEWNCDHSCGECNGENYNDCIYCSSSDDHRIDSADYEDGGTCICEDGYYDDEDLICEECHYSCLTCDDGGSSDCLTCNTLDNRIDTPQTGSCFCDDGWYDDGSNSLCQPCDYTCLTCDGSQSDQCLTCETNYHRTKNLNDECPCDDHWFNSGDEPECLICDSVCDTCENDSSCFDCSNPSYDKRYFDEDEEYCYCNMHYYTVDNDYYDSSDDQCQECDITCFQCNDGSADSCTGCHLQIQKRQPGDHDYYDGDLLLTGPNDNILQVYQDNTFYNVDWNSEFNDNLAWYACNYVYNNVDDVDITEVDCPCQSGSGSACLNNQIAYKIDNFNSSDDCWENYDFNYSLTQYYYESLKTCVQITCSSDSFLDDIIQVDEDTATCDCLIGYYYDNSGNGECLPCHPNCLNCTGPNLDDCTECNDIFHRTLNSEDDTCECDDRYFDVNDLSNEDVSGFNRSPMCQPCHYACFNCLNDSPQSCTECSSADHRGTYDIAVRRFLSDTPNTSQWSPTPWIQTLDFVSTLYYQHYPYTKAGHGNQLSTERSGECPALFRYFDDHLETVDSDRNFAKPCHYSCLTCDGTLYSDCLTCEDDVHRALVPTYSSCTCVQRYYDNGSDVMCYECHYSCANCWDTSDSADDLEQLCAQCDNRVEHRSFFQISDAPNGVGICQCDDGYGDIRSNPPIAKCVKCHTSCRHCDAELSSSRCAPNNFDLSTQNPSSVIDNGCYETKQLSSATGLSRASPTTKNEQTVTSNANKETHYYSYAYGYCVCILHHYAITPELEQPSCLVCPKDCLDCLYSTTLNTRVNCVSCSTMQSRTTQISYNTTPNTSTDYSQTTYGNFGQPRNTCPCNSGYFDQIFREGSQESCSNCHYSCKECINSNGMSNCIWCDTSIFRTANSDGSITQIASNTIGSCYCDAHYYDDGSSHDCKSCHYSCWKCQTSNTSTNCSNCRANTIIHRTFSTNSCPCDPFYYDITNTELCGTCHWQCYHCNETNSTNCTNCGENVSELTSGHRTYNSDNSTCLCDTLKHWRQNPNNPLDYICTCEDRYYNPDTTLNSEDQCLECHHSCLTCQDAQISSCSICTTLDFRHRRDTGTGITYCDCDAHYFDNNPTNIFTNHACSICDYTCWNCSTNAVDCTSCVTNSLRTLDTSVHRCNCDPFYYDTHVYDSADIESGITCSQCNWQCYNCDGPTASECSACGESVSEITSGHRIYNGTGHTCLCDTLSHWRQDPSNPLSYMCTCQDYYFNAQPTTHTDNSCTQCHHSCITCDATAITSCLTCETNINRHFVTATHRCDCDIHYFDINVTANLFTKHDCDICDYTCWECSTTSTTCLNCVTGSHRSIVNNICKCDPFYYDVHVNDGLTADQGIICAKCHFTCFTCDGPLIDNCLTCAPSTLGHRVFNSNTNTCDCISGFYDDLYHHDCSICDTVNGYFYDTFSKNDPFCRLSSELIPFCYRIDTIKTLQLPISIPNQPNTTTGFNDALYDACELYNNQCGSQLLVSGGSQLAIVTLIDQSILNLACTKCMQGYILIANTTKKQFECIWTPGTCPKPPYKEYTIGKAGYCGTCPDGCATCSYDTNSQKVQCLTCEADYAPLNKWDSNKFSVCYPTPTNPNYCDGEQYYGRGGEKLQTQCWPCPDGCKNCYYDWEVNNIFCKSCLINYARSDINNYLCKFVGTQCGLGKYLITLNSGENYCDNCPCGCKKCSYNPSILTVECTECFSGTGLNTYGLITSQGSNSSTKQCLPLTQRTCPVSQYANCPQTGCVACPIECTVCSKNYASNFPQAPCTACSLGYKLNGSVCLTTSCLDGQRPAFNPSDPTLQICINCKSNCKYCQTDYNQLPPQEVCYECIYEFHLKQGSCYQDQVCQVGEYKLSIPDAVLQLTENITCNTCPSRCTTCQAANYRDQNTAIQCGGCIAGYNLIGTDCIYSVLEIECSNDQFSYFDSKLNQFLCGECKVTEGDIKANCLTCSLAVDGLNIDCFTCPNGYYLGKSIDSQQFKECIAFPICLQGYYPTQISPTTKEIACQQCPDKCSSCELLLANDPLSVICTGCVDKYSLTSQKICAKVSSDSRNNCATGTYEKQVIDEGKKFVFCLSCPLGCETCSISGETQNKESLLKCFSCKPTHTFIDSTYTCLPKCGAYLYYSESQSQCANCNPACSVCTGNTISDCQVCNVGYTFDKNNDCVRLQPLPLQGQCGKNSYWDFFNQECLCVNPLQVFDPTTYNCLDQSFYFSNCGGGYYSTIISEVATCLPCSQNCNSCTGSSASQCKACKDGYYISKANSQCTQCPENCKICSSTNTCLQCDEGFYKYIQNGVESFINSQYLYYGPIISCHSTCPSGTLPNINSLYYLNRNMFDSSFLTTALSSYQEFQLEDGNVQNSIALGVNHQPIFQESDIPWNFNEKGQPVMNGKTVQLECQPCKYNCGSCIEGALQSIRNSNGASDCIFAQACEDGQKLEDGEYGLCVQVADGEYTYIQGIVTQSLTIDNIQPVDQQLILSAAYSPNDEETEYFWELDQQDINNRIRKDHYSQYLEAAITGATYTKVDYSLQNQFEIEVNLWANVARNTKTITIPPENLKKNTIYKFILRCKQKNDPNTIYTSFIYIPVRQMYPERPLSELGVTPNVIYRFPYEGVSMQDPFTFILSFGNVDQIINNKAEGQWTFILNIQGGLSLINTDLNSKIVTFSELQLETDNLNLVKISVQKQGQYFVTYRYILSKLNTNLAVGRLRSLATSDLPIDWNLFQGITPLYYQVLNDCPNATQDWKSYYTSNLLLDVEGTCRTSDQKSVKFCCGLGKCSEYSYLPFTCQCNSGNEGTYCQQKNNNYSDQGKLWVKQLLDKLILEDEEEFQINPVDEETYWLGNQLGYVTSTNVDTFIQAFQKMAQYQWIDEQQTFDMLNKVKTQIVSLINLQDSTQLKSLQNLVESVQTHTFENNFFSTVDNQKRMITIIQDLKVQIADMLKQQLLNSNKRQVYLEGDTGSYGVISKQDVVSIDTQNFPITLLDYTGQEVASSIEINVSLVSNQPQVLAEIIQTPQIQLQQYSTQNISVIANAYNINLYNSQQQQVTIENLQGTCPIKNIFKINYLNFPKDVENRILCLYLDQNNKISQNGCKNTDFSYINEGNNNIQVTCCCTHLTAFTLGLGPVPPEDGEDDNKQPPVVINASKEETDLAAIVAPAVIVPVVCIAIIIGIWCWWKKKKQHAKPQGKYLESPKKSEEDEIKLNQYKDGRLYKEQGNQQVNLQVIDQYGPLTPDQLKDHQAISAINKEQQFQLMSPQQQQGQNSEKKDPNTEANLPSIQQLIQQKTELKLKVSRRQQSEIKSQKKNDQVQNE